MNHQLKINSAAFDDVVSGRKTFEIRKDDRGYAVGDILTLCKTRHGADEHAVDKPLEYPGEAIQVEVQHMLHGPIYGLAAGWVIMSISVKKMTLDATPNDVCEQAQPECPACGSEKYEGPLRECTYCGGAKCSFCDMGDNCECPLCEGDDE